MKSSVSFFVLRTLTLTNQSIARVIPLAPIIRPSMTAYAPAPMPSSAATTRRAASSVLARAAPSASHLSSMALVPRPSGSFPIPPGFISHAPGFCFPDPRGSKPRPPGKLAQKSDSARDISQKQPVPHTPGFQFPDRRVSKPRPPGN